MSTDRPRSPQPISAQGVLPDLSTDVVTRLVAGRCYFTDMSAANFRTLLAFAQSRGLTVVPAGCQADLSDVEEDFEIQGPFVAGRQLIWTSASLGVSEPFDAEEVQDMTVDAFEELDADFESQMIRLGGIASSVEDGVFLCNTGPLSSGTLVFGVAGTRDEAETLGGEYIWGHDMDKLPHDTGVIGEVVAHVDHDEVEKVDFSDEADHLRRQDAVPYSREPVYFLVAQYD
ncbi:MAG: hypothetical protein ACOC9J_03225 [Persicimonas sp.]